MLRSFAKGTVLLRIRLLYPVVRNMFAEMSPMRTTIAVSWLTLLLAIPPSVTGKDKPVTVPFTTNPDGLVIVPASFGGSITGHVILDTGAGLDALPPSIVQKLQGKPIGQFTGFRMNGDRLDLSLYTITELAVGPLVKKNAVVATWDVLDTVSSKGIEGIISLNDFRQQPFTLDFGLKVLVFETRESLAQRREAGKIVPLKFNDQRGIALDSFAQFVIGTQPGECEIDTGSPSATVSTRYMQSLGIDPKRKDVQKRVPEIALAVAPKISIVRPDVSFSDIIYDCVVGVDFWAGKTLTYNIADRELIVSNRSQ